MKKLADGDYSFKLSKLVQATDFLESENADTTNKESLDRNNAITKGTLSTVKKLTHLIKYRGKAEKGTLTEMFEKSLGGDFVEKPMQDDTTESCNNESLSSSTNHLGDKDSQAWERGAGRAL